MIRYSALALAVFGVLTTGCSSLEERQIANGSFEYVNDEVGSNRIATPDDLVSPRHDDEYEIPRLSEGSDGPTGRELRIDSPNVVMPMVQGSRVLDGVKGAHVYFDQLGDDMPLEQTLWQSVISYLEGLSVPVKRFDRDAGVLVTGWQSEGQAQEKGGWLSFGDDNTKTGYQYQYRYELDMKPHGRSGEFSVSMVGAGNAASGDLVAVKALEKERQEVAHLNALLIHHAQEQKIAQIKEFREAQKGLNLELAQNDSGDAVYTVNAEYDIAWTRMQLVLRKMGFVVKDLDKSIGLLFVDYTGADDGFWSGLFGGGEALELDEQPYRFQLTPKGERVQITMMTDDSDVLDQQTLEAVYPQFAAVMAEDDLDI